MVIFESNVYESTLHMHRCAQNNNKLGAPQEMAHNKNTMKLHVNILYLELHSQKYHFDYSYQFRRPFPPQFKWLYFSVGPLEVRRLTLGPTPSPSGGDLSRGGGLEY